ncbi:MAG: FG-GAP-like repeat-containing protein, partial [Sulfobacillus sp.]
MVYLTNPGSGTLSATPLPQAVSLGLASLTFNVADVNEDGINDLIAVEESSNSPSTPPGIFVFLGHADGTFANPVEYATGGGPIAVAIDDVNGDGKLDLIVLNSGLPPNNIKVLLGNGDGTFKAAINAGSTNPLADNMFSVAAGDFNGDGKIDLVLSDGEIMLGNGNGTFAASVFTLPMPANSFGNVPVVGDFNHDGKLDVAMNLPSTSAGQVTEGEVMVFLGNGNGTFTTGNSYVNIPNSGHMATEDIDGDGNLDLIIGSGDNGVYSAGPNTNGVFQFLMGRGDGTFAGAPGYQNVAYGGLNSVAPTFAVGDFNGDGKPDILTDVESSNNIQGMVLLAGDGQGNFTQGSTIKGDSPLALLAADMNGDSHLDAVFYGYSTANSSYGISVALGNGDGTFQAATNFLLPSGKFNDFVVGDFNGDGKPDVMVTMTSFSTNAGAIYLFLGNGDGTLQSPVSIDTPPQAYSIAAGDFNGDGKLDFAVTNTSNGSANTTGAVLVYLNQGSGTFAKPVSYAANMFPGPIVVADVNLDGKPDLVVASSDNATVTSTNPFGPHGTLNVLLGNGDGTFQTATNSPLNDPGYSNLAVADMNQDGVPDVIVGDNNPPFFYTQILYGKGDGTFPTGNSLQMGLNSQSVTAVDVNGDKRPDLLLTTGTSYANLDVFTNQFSGKTISTLPATTTALSVSPNPAVAGQTVTFTAQVSASSGTTVPTGTVNFMNGSTQLGTGTLDSSGAATYTTSSLSTGSYPITAVYSGDTNYSGSTSSAVTLVVNAQPVAAATTTTLATSAATVNAGQNVTFTAT